MASEDESVIVLNFTAFQAKCVVSKELIRLCGKRYIYQYIKDSKVEICRGGRLTIAVEMIAVETIAVEAIAVEAITSCADPGGGGGLINDRC